MSARFICIDGPDGSGKSEQSNLLVAKLQKEGYKVEFFDFPQYTEFFGEIAGQMLSGEFGPIDNIHPKIASLPYAFDRFEAAPKILKTISDGGIAVANRFTLANLAHQSARLPIEEREDFVNFILKLENEILKIPVPELYIHLDVPTEISQNLIAGKLQRDYLRKGRNMDELEKNYEHQVEAAKMYKELASHLPNKVSINCCDEKGKLKSIGEIHQLVWSEVSAHLNKTPEGQTRSTERRS